MMADDLEWTIEFTVFHIVKIFISYLHALKAVWFLTILECTTAQVWGAKVNTGIWVKEDGSLFAAL